MFVRVVNAMHVWFVYVCCICCLSVCVPCGLFICAVYVVCLCAACVICPYVVHMWFVLMWCMCSLSICFAYVICPFVVLLVCPYVTHVLFVLVCIVNGMFVPIVHMMCIWEVHGLQCRLSMKCLRETCLCVLWNLSVCCVILIHVSCVTCQCVVGFQACHMYRFCNFSFLKLRTIYLCDTIQRSVSHVMIFVNKYWSLHFKTMHRARMVILTASKISPHISNYEISMRTKI